MRNKSNMKEFVSEEKLNKEVEPETQEKTRVSREKQLKVRESDTEPQTQKKTKSFIRVKMRHITRSGDFADIFKNGEKISNKLLSLYIKPGGPEKDLFVGVVLPSKFAPMAVQRNYIRRRIYAYFQIHKQRWGQGTRLIPRLARDVSAKRKKDLAEQIEKELENTTQSANG